MTRDDAISAIRTALRKRSGKAWSVKGGRGTSSGWITISSPPRRLGCSRCHEYSAAGRCRCGRDYLDPLPNDADGNLDRSGVCAEHACSENCYSGYMTPEDRAELGELLGLADVHTQGVSIAAANDYYAEYVARAAGLTPAVVGTPYWD
jgi:hypothetical protein